MTDTKLPAIVQGRMPSGIYTLLVSRSVLEMLAQEDRHAEVKQVLDVAMRQALDPEGMRIPNWMFPDTPLVIHVCRERRAVVVLARYAGWPHRLDEYLEELLPFCTPWSLA